MQVERIDERAQLRLVCGLSASDVGANDVGSAAMNQRLQHSRRVGSGLFGFVEQRVEHRGKNGLELARLAEREVRANPREDFLPAARRLEGDGEVGKQRVEDRGLGNGVVDEPRG